MAAAKSSRLTAWSGLGLGNANGAGEFLFLGLAEQARVRRAGVGGVVLLLLDAEDVRRALGAGEEVFAVVGVEEFAQRLDAADDQHEIVLAGQREHGVDEIVARALLAELDLQAVGEEGEQILLPILQCTVRRYLSCEADRAKASRRSAPKT